MVSWAGEPQLPVLLLNLTCIPAALTSHLHRASTEDQVHISTRQVLLKDASNDNSRLVSSQTNQDHQCWVEEHIRRPWAIEQMRVVLKATTPVKTIILEIESRRN